MKVGVKIMPRNEVLDTQGRTVGAALKRQGYEVEDCKVGKFVILDLKGEDSSKVMEQASEIAKSILCNPLIESFETVELS